MQLTSQGFKKPESNDSGSEFFADVAFNVERMDGMFSRPHQTHTGASFSASGTEYRKLITLPISPLAYNFDWVNIIVKVGNTTIYPKIEKVSSTTFYLYMPVNTEDVDVYYV